MRVVHIADQPFAQREGDLLRRLEIGLIDEGVGVVRVRPAGLLGENTAGLGARVEYDTSRVPRLGPSRATRVLREIERQVGSESGAIDVVHAWGHGCWSVALDLAREAQADLVVSLHDRPSLQHVRALEHRARRLKFPAPLVMAPDEAHAQALSGHSRSLTVRVVPWGVHLHAGKDTRAARAADHVASICVVGSGASPKEIDALFDGFERLAARHPETLVFLDGSLVARHRQHFKRLRTLRFETTPSLIEDLESHRQTALEADVLVAPESSGEYRSIVLEAMGSRMGVVVRRDPLIDLYKESNGIIVVPDPVGSAWESAIVRALDEGERAALAMTARRHIEQHHLAYKHVRGVIEAYESVRGQAPIAMHGA